ncbi:MAG TPA: hypothetical protein ENJ11_05500 [Gammaproteobacteria bacterium]|nr:hypothetical protein [Gammaproteobacteria bacterium]
MQWLFRFRICIIICLAVILITAAVGFSVLRAALPYATGYKDEIQQIISKQIGLPVEIKSLAADIDWFSPRLKLLDVAVFDKAHRIPLFHFEEAFVELDVMASIMRREAIIGDVGLVGIDLSIEKLSDTEWLIQGIRFNTQATGRSSELPEPLIYMIQNADYLLHDSNIYYQDHTNKHLNMVLLDVNIDVQNSFNNHRIKFSMNLPDEYGRSLAAVAELSGDIDRLDGEFYIEASAIRLSQWNRKFRFLTTHQLDADVDVLIWGELKQNVLQSLTTQLQAQNLLIKNRSSGKAWQTEYLSGNARYLRDGDFWNVSLADFYFGSEDQPEWGRPLNLQASNDGDFYHVSADFLRVQDITRLLDVVLDGDAHRQYSKLATYRPAADIYNLDLRLPVFVSDEDVPAENRQQLLLNKARLDASIVNLGLTIPQKKIRLDGLDAELHYDDSRLDVKLASENASFEMPDMFVYPLQADFLRGDLEMRRTEEGWRLATDSLQLKNDHINTFSRLELRLLADNKVFVDAQTDFYDAWGKYATRYLPVGVMKPKLIDWLHMAVTDGYVPQGQFILYGNLSDFPFKQHNGIFQVMFEARDVNMQYLKGWPKLENTSGIVKFENQSLILTHARSVSRGIRLYDAVAEIPDLRHPVLGVNLQASGNNADVQDYVWNSPLDRRLGRPLRLFQIDGESLLSLKLDIPFLHPETLNIEGQLNLVNASVYYPAMGYEMEAVNGMINFTRDSIFADSVRAEVQKKPVELNIVTREKAGVRTIIYHLDGELGADYLLQKYEWVPQDWVDGSGQWSIDVEVPRKKKDYLVRIRARSDLDGISLNVSDKVKKPAAEKMAYKFDLSVMDEGGLHLESSASRWQAEPLLNLYAQRDREKFWHFTVNSDYLRGKGDFAEGLDHDTEVVLNMEKVDLHSLFVSTGKKAGKKLRPSDFPALRWQAKTVLWDDWMFTDVNLETDWNEHGMLINRLTMNGPSMSFSARGSWLTSWTGAHTTVLQGKVSSSNCGNTLAGLGFERSLDRCTYKASFNAMWSAEPYAFSWANMKGSTSFEMKDGEIVSMNPGAGGRLLGLMNIFKLANRLSLDFDDVTRKGFSFDRIKGEFEFVNGKGSLKNCDIYAPAANINIFGSIGLIDRDYNLLMRVKPHTDTLTIAGGTLLGGVAIGAGLALIQKVFDVGVGHNVYSITGSWDDPKIEQIVQRTDEEAEDDF